MAIRKDAAFADAARLLANRLRFSGEIGGSTTHKLASQGKVFENSILQNELRISNAVTPGLASHIIEVANRLELPRESVDAFVYASSDLQASCFAPDPGGCVIRFSSGLVDLLDDNEFMFVAGHEIGHFLLDHGFERRRHNTESAEYYIEQRSQEISADRVGLVSCGSLEVAARAMMKTISGLSSEHLRFDLGAFVRQLEDVEVTWNPSTSSHPSIFVRCRALLWFSYSDGFDDATGRYVPSDLSKLDQRIEQDMKRFVDGPTRKAIEDAKVSLLLWSLAQRVSEDGVFDKREQAAVASLVGMENAKKLKVFLSDLPFDEVRPEVEQRVESARQELIRLIPLGFETAEREVSRKLADVSVVR